MASLVKTSGIALRVIEYSETSQVVYLCTRGHGQVHLLAKGARRPRKDGRGPFSLLDQCQVVYLARPSGGLYVATDWAVTKVCRQLREDLGAICAAMFAAELALATTHEEEEDGRVFELLDGFLDELDRLAATPNRRKGLAEQARLRYELGLLRCLGLLPELEKCAECGRPLRERRASGRTPRFSAREGGCLCPDCGMADASASALSLGAVAALRRFAAGPAASKASVVLTDTQLSEMDRALRDHFEYQLGRPLRTAGWIVRA